MPIVSAGLFKTLKNTKANMNHQIDTAVKPANDPAKGTKRGSVKLTKAQ